MMKVILLSTGLIAGGLLSTGAQERVEEREVIERPAITIPLPIPGVGVERRERIETESRAPVGGCETKTVEKETPRGDTTVTKRRCD